MNKDIKLLMKLQYEFPLSNRPFRELGRELNLSENKVLKMIEEYRENGVITRIGIHIDYRALDKNFRALVGIKADKDKIVPAAKFINKMDGVKHNYLRRGSRYNIWFTIKSSSEKHIYKLAEELAEKLKIKDYVVLPTKKVYKLDVRYNLYKGISWSPPVLQKPNIPSIRKLGINQYLINDLIYHFNPSKRPFKQFSIKYGIQEDSILDIIEKLRNLGVISYFGAQLNSEKLGFKENAMNIVKTENGDVERICRELVEKIPEITHCVERIVDPVKWNFPIYFTVHSRERDKIRLTTELTSKITGVMEVRSLFSTANLRGGEYD